MYEYRALVVKVYDGDTIVVDIDLGFGIMMKNQSVRLLGVDTPEIRGKERNEGLEVKIAVENKILGKWVKIKTMKDKKGKYGRWLVNLWVDDLCINNWLVTEGLAEEYDTN